jgi:hypothetical protein
MIEGVAFYDPRRINAAAPVRSAKTTCLTLVEPSKQPAVGAIFDQVVGVGATTVSRNKFDTVCDVIAVELGVDGNEIVGRYVDGVYTRLFSALAPGGAVSKDEILRLLCVLSRKQSLPPNLVAAVGPGPVLVREFVSLCHLARNAFETDLSFPQACAEALRRVRPSSPGNNTSSTTANPVRPVASLTQTERLDDAPAGDVAARRSRRRSVKSTSSPVSPSGGGGGCTQCTTKAAEVAAMQSELSSVKQQLDALKHALATGHGLGGGGGADDTSAVALMQERVDLITNESLRLAEEEHRQ